MFLVQNLFGPKILWTQNFVDPYYLAQFFLYPNFFQLKISLVSKLLLTQIFFVPNYFYTKLLKQLFWVQRKLWDERSDQKKVVPWKKQDKCYLHQCHWYSCTLLKMVLESYHFRFGLKHIYIVSVHLIFEMVIY